MRKITWHNCESCGKEYIIEDGRRCNCTDEQISAGYERQQRNSAIDNAIYLLKSEGYRVLKQKSKKPLLNAKRNKY